MRLENKTAVVTGGSSGIGRSIAIQFAEEGANVAIGDISKVPKNKSTSTVEEIDERGDAIFRETDVTRMEACQALIDSTVDEFGGVDILINNAGGFPRGARGKSIAEISRSEWDSILESNLNGVFNCTKAVIPHISKSHSGRIINIASKMALVGHSDAPAYSAAKGGVVSLTKQVAIDLAPDGVTVNAIVPGIVATGTKEYRFDDKGDRMRENTPLPYLGEPKDVARSAVFLASADGKFITGHSLVVDGGWTAQ